MQSIQKTVVFIWETLKIVIISLAIIIPIRYFLIQPFFVRGASMEPNFLDGDYLIIDELSYHLRKPVRDEVIVFRYPLDKREFFIKRIIGLPGETIQIQGGKIYIFNTQYPQGLALNESVYLPSDEFTGGDLKMKLDPDEYFVLGDNRGASSDSRRWGVLHSDLIIGKVLVRAFPFNRFKVFQYQLTSF